VFDAYLLTILTTMIVWSIVALGLNVITGMAGQFNLGIGVYMGTGAYTTAMLTTAAGFNFWEAAPLAVLASMAMGVLTGLPALRVREDSLAVLTIGLVFVFESLLVYLPYFGGPIGINRIPRVSIGSFTFDNDAYVLLAAVALMAAIGVSMYLKRSWLGLALESVREDEHATNVIGIHPARFKLYAFAIGAGLAGLGGVIYAHFMRYITPYDFGFIPSIYVLVMLVFGGIGTIRGAVFGAFLLTALPELIRFVQDYRNLMFGAALVLLMLYEPAGLLGDESWLWKRIKRSVASVRLLFTSERTYAQNQ
jgi:branched-chain amino acid transport system permease protein